ncbi:aldolase [Duganella sp. FT92W]|uniref:Aldolase n=1 Tax=Pseudoduganella rivuli TaxID=2666085 RepID=A0A7X2IQU2_9BURK|nr:aldolase [Pseudoduganella rivuli]MRV74092.1 aldolase [Pseudoduganella rivuli]
MTAFARKRRWAHFQDGGEGRCLVVPIDHGLTMGPIDGLHSPHQIKSWLSPDLVTGVVLHKGMAEHLKCVSGCGMMIHLNGALNLDESPDCKVMFTSVEAAVRLGADGVSIQANFTPATAAYNLHLIGSVVDEAHRYGLPVLVMVYDKTGEHNSLNNLRHFMRAAVELGADALKVAAPANLERIPELLDGIQAHTPVLFAGGALDDETRLLDLADASVRYDAAGICAGRNVFQHPDPRKILRKTLDILRRRMPDFDGKQQIRAA